MKKITLFILLASLVLANDPKGVTFSMLPKADGYIMGAVITVAPEVAKDAKLTLRWKDELKDEKGFVIERSSDDGKSFVKVAEVAANETKWSASTLEPGKFIYRVKAI
jgi:hypothetical protein